MVAVVTRELGRKLVQTVYFVPGAPNAPSLAEKRKYGVRSAVALKLGTLSLYVCAFFFRSDWFSVVMYVPGT